MPIKQTNDEGVEVEYFTPDEVAAKDAEIARLAALNSERGENFSKFNEKVQGLETNLSTLQTKLIEYEKKEITNARESSFAKYGDSEDIQSAIKENYDMLAMPESTPAEVAARADKAARMAGLSLNNANPLFVNPIGEAPKPKTANEKDQFMQSDKAASALKAMGITEAPKT